MKDSFFWMIRDADVCRPITAREADSKSRRGDAGCHNEFVVIAPTHSMAHVGAIEWVRVRADDGISTMPDGLHLEERIYQKSPVRGYMVLRVDL